jgi:hypothetical protein
MKDRIKKCINLEMEHNTGTIKRSGIFYDFFSKYYASAKIILRKDRKGR